MGYGGLVIKVEVEVLDGSVRNTEAGKTTKSAYTKQLVLDSQLGNDFGPGPFEYEEDSIISE